MKLELATLADFEFMDIIKNLLVVGGHVWGFAGYVALSVLAGIALVALGYR